MDTVILAGVTRHDPDAIPDALARWLGAGTRHTTRRQGDDLHVTVHAAPDQVEALVDNVVRFYLVWRRARGLRASPSPQSPDADGFVDPAALSYVPAPRR